MGAHVRRQRRPAARRPRRVVGALAAAGLLLLGTACRDGGGGRPDELGAEEGGPNPGVLPTLPGGVELAPRDVATVLVGTGLAYGSALPSEVAAANAIVDDPEVAKAAARRIYAVSDGHRLANGLFLTLDGSQLFDAAALAAFERAMVEAIGAAHATEVPVAGRAVLRAQTKAGVALGYRQDAVLVVVSGPVPQDVERTVTLQIEAIARGERGSDVPVTPIVATPVSAAFVPVPTVSFVTFRPPEEEMAPEPPGFLGATAIEGRYGVVAGERRTLVWVFALAPIAYPSAEVLDRALPAFVSGRADGAAAVPGEVVDRLVLAATNEPGTRSARVFRHRGLLLLVEGDRPDQLDAVVTAWITALGPG